MNFRYLYLLWFLLLSGIIISCKTTHKPSGVSNSKMEEIYQTVKTPYKYGVVFQHPDSTKMMDSPSVFRWNGQWCMTYIIFDGRGYETWLAESDDLIHWTSKGRILSFTDSGWDANQKAGYMALLDTRWAGEYTPAAYNGKYWMSYLGGSVSGYEAGQLGVGIANTTDPGNAVEWQRMPGHVLSANDKDARWFENKTIFKSTVIKDDKRHTGHLFVMYYNAAGDTASYESIGMAVSDDMIHWSRYGKDPVISRYKKGTISGDAQIVQIGNLYVMFYFGAFWNEEGKAFDRFACSYDLIHWTDWSGPDLIRPSEPYDETFAHKPFVIKWKGVVYHFYNAVGKNGRVIALATSAPLK
ncbi:glycoside hydrolase family protein [Flavihumibacter profundi]|jgi:predicted GH43/DUF377 family glycosyl hydrolase|uniref:glycosylase n=1 Tax=Flavihumibacter profundi TaxID=2716883 RepID=UPI001CC4B00E|nr:glycosylase [Flavihumibacter profundi]MBZ5857684.1 glycosylase [Flavihumibacter profundi]